MWLLQVECMDYYCGCGGGHPVGLFSSRRRADRALELLNEGTEFALDLMATVTELEVDVVPAQERMPYVS
jgi:hypothetical protein